MKLVRAVVRLSTLVGLAALAAGCTLLTFDPPVVASTPPLEVLTASDAAIVETAVAKRLSGQAVSFERLVAGNYYTSTRYKFITAFTVCGQARTATAVNFFVGYLSRERGTFEIAGIAASGPEQKSIIALCIRNNADSTALSLR